MTTFVSSWGSSAAFAPEESDADAIAPQLATLDAAQSASGGKH
jgi:hypothetical protein